MIDLLGADRVLFGSDYPHPEGMSDPITFVDDLAGLNDEMIRKVMGGNLACLMHVAHAVGDRVLASAPAGGVSDSDGSAV